MRKKLLSLTLVLIFLFLPHYVFAEKSSGELGNGVYAGINQASWVRDEYGNDCLVVYYTFLNSQDEHISAAETLLVEVYQGGIRCESTDYPIGYNDQLQLEKNTAISIAKAFFLNNTESPVSITISPAPPFSGGVRLTQEYSLEDINTGGGMTSQEIAGEVDDDVFVMIWATGSGLSKSYEMYMTIKYYFWHHRDEPLSFEQAVSAQVFQGDEELEVMYSLLSDTDEEIDAGTPLLVEIPYRIVDFSTPAIVTVQATLPRGDNPKILRRTYAFEDDFTARMEEWGIVIHNDGPSQ